MKRLLKYFEKSKNKPSNKKDIKGQLELQIDRPIEPDRNAGQGGRSFYFFDFDDNIAFLSTPGFLFHKKTKKELAISSADFAKHHRQIGISGPYKDYEIILDDKFGSFRNFRDQKIGPLKQLLGKKQNFLHDVSYILKQPTHHWQGPSWNCFYHACLNQRPVALITARGHQPATIKKGISLLVKNGHLPLEPNYLDIWPVSNIKTRHSLGDSNLKFSTAQLKKAAIRRAVQKAIEVYGESPHHRFGMSDDDPHNIELIADEMKLLKKVYPNMSFFIIETHSGRYTKTEIFMDHREAMMCSDLKNQQEFTTFEQLGWDSLD